MNAIKFWKKSGFDVASYKWKLEERRNQSFNGSGSDTSNTNTYTYNELGFRGDSIYKDGFRIMSVGCSHTEGVGASDGETWPHHFSKLIPGAVDLNAGFGGRSNDYVARCIITMIDTFRPNLVNIMYTYPSRKEYYRYNGDLEPFHMNPWGYFEEENEGKEEYKAIARITHDENDLINWYKNHLLITNFLQLRNIPYTWNGSFLMDDSVDDENRFDGGYGDFREFSIDGKHATNKHNEKYAKKLYDFIKDNFPKYLP
jgi:hypothetical protein